MAFALFTFLLSMKQGSLIGNQEFFMMSMIIARYKFVLLNNFKQNLSNMEKRKPHKSINKQFPLHSD